MMDLTYSFPSESDIRPVHVKGLIPPIGAQISFNLHTEVTRKNQKLVANRWVVSDIQIDVTIADQDNKMSTQVRLAHAVKDRD